MSRLDNIRGRLLSIIGVLVICSCAVAAEKAESVRMCDGVTIGTYVKTPPGNGPWPEVSKKVCGNTAGGADRVIKSHYTYVSQRVRGDVELIGPVTLKLFAATDARDTDFTAVLIDVRPDGKIMNVAEGIIRAPFRDSIWEEPKLLTPGKPFSTTRNARRTLFRPLSPCVNSQMIRAMLAAVFKQEIEGLEDDVLNLPLLYSSVHTQT